MCATETLALISGLRESNELFDLFYANKFDEVKKRLDMKSKEDLTMLHARGFLSFLYALLASEPMDIARAIEDIEQTLKCCVKKRNQKSLFQNLSSFWWKADVDMFTNNEVFAELIYAECQIMMGLLTFFSDQSLMSLVRAALRVNSSNHSFKICETILNERNSWKSSEIKMQFESGVLNGIGTFNLVVSMLPTKILKLLTFVGFSGDKDLGLAMIKRCTDLKDGVRSRVAALTIQGFRLCEIESEYIDSLVNEYRAKFPSGVFVLFFSAKRHLIKGEINEAKEEFLKCIALQDSWKQVHNICNWDLVWCFALQCDWQNASSRALKLREECDYSRATNEYQFAVFKMMQMEEENRNDLQSVIDMSMRFVIKLKKRLAGKTVPHEKFICTRAAQYVQNGREPIIALMELFYIWNIFSMTSNKESIIKPWLDKVDKKISELKERERRQFDDIAVLLLAKGVLHRNKDDNEVAVKCFQTIIDSEKKIESETYVAPHAALELGITYLKWRKFDQSKAWLEKAKCGYEKFLNESIVNLRVTAALRRLKQLKDEESEKVMHE
ncbi:tetratricopeptide repeat protein 39B-like protein [Dinothrombium tinctorium]|uniref:Tetratricopeptide repeat protein 39B-like protein n=1 Tax=Dinothrombium tinctorium TaxID=1965070 RepID=A0A443RL87_9ACAR|nr:tetratricopeptide repeat protein 39B-like protein [Dinothrombium tinctorium]